MNTKENKMPTEAAKHRVRGTFASTCLEIIASVNGWDRDWEVVEADLIAKTEKLRGLSPVQMQRMKAACQIIGKAAWLQFFTEI